jgi:hypothetical protein
MLRSAARSKGTWVAMLAALGLILIVVLTSPGSHPKPAQAQETGLTNARASLVIDLATDFRPSSVPYSAECVEGFFTKFGPQHPNFSAQQGERRCS